jgi:hypothetical protein
MILILFVLLLIVIFIKNYLNIEVYTNSCKKKINKQKKFNQCLSDMKKILDNANQKFFLISGTLLGYYREKAFIDHDQDIDIGIFYDDLNINIKNMISKSKSFKLYKEYGKYKDSYELTFKHKNGVNIDIFIHYKIKKNYYYTSSFGNLCNKKKEKYCKFGHYINSLKKIKFLNNNYYIPCNTKEYLVEQYGMKWNKPKKVSYIEGLNGGYFNLIN